MIATDRRRRFLTMDVMRGVAAIAVALLHLGHRINGPSPHAGDLAVDAFFVLSGFVLSHAYDDRLKSGEMTMVEFMLARLHRLAPLYLLGLIVAVVAQLVQRSAALEGSALLMAVAMNSLGLPWIGAPKGENLFILNAPFWSLFFELWVANTSFVLFHRWLTGRFLRCVVLGSAALLAVLLVPAHMPLAGWTRSTLIVGLARVTFSFYIGVALARLYRARTFKTPAHPWLIIGLFIACLVWTPRSSSALPIYHLFVILFAFPLLIYSAAGVLEKRSWLGEQAGDTSYALYAIHYPLITIALAAEGSAAEHWWLTEPLFVLIVLPLSWLAAKGDLTFRKASTSYVRRVADAMRRLWHQAGSDRSGSRDSLESHRTPHAPS
jgi:peptidoglycan/LPS O-acetylase OafA/YrhL